MKSTRREFVKQTCAAALTLSAAATVSRSSGGDHRMTIIDTHPHFYDPRRPEGVPWPSKTDEFLYRPIYPKDYREQAVRQPVTGVVVVEASNRVQDNQWILDLAKDDPFIVGLCGNLPLGTPEFAKHLKRFSENQLWIGMRHRERNLAKDLERPEFLRDVRLLAENNKQLDVLVNGPQLPLVDKLAKAAPELRIVIDHLANTRIDGKNVDPQWKAGIQQVAKRRNVYMKVSGLVEGTGKRDGTAATGVGFYLPWLEIIWKSFGEDRLIYGSNWPVSARFASLKTVQSLVYDFFAEQGAVPLEKVFSGNARKVYHWVDRSSE